MFAAIIFAFSLQSVAVDLDDSVSCVDKIALETTMREALEKAGLAEASLAIHITVNQSDSGGSQELVINLQVNDAAEQLLHSSARSLTRSDCDSAPRLLALIVVRALQGLPESAWIQPNPKPPEPAPTKQSVAISRKPFETRPTSKSEPLHVDFEPCIGLSFGQLLRVEALASGAIHRRGPLRISVAIFGAHGRSGHFANGLAQLSELGLGGGLDYRLRWNSDLTIAPVIGVLFGVKHARGEGFSESRSDQSLLAALRAGATLHYQRGFFSLLAHVPLARTRLNVEGSAEGFEESRLRLVLLLGFSWKVF